MGEAKRKRDKMTDAEKLTQELTRQLADKGLLIEAGWASLAAVWLPKDTPPNQVKDCRWAFMAGAQHLFSSIMTVMDEDREPTAADLRKMDLIHAELEAFRIEMEMSLPVEGSA